MMDALIRRKTAVRTLSFTLILLILALVRPAAAYDLGTARPAKSEARVAPPPPDPDVLRQGGDTIFSAVTISIPQSFGGTTAGYVDDYDEACPYYGSTSPDVVYTFTPTHSTALVVDLGGSTYDTKIYIYDQGLNLIACNDDFYSDYTSRLDNVPVLSGVQYFLVIDGYGGDYGSYTGFIYENFGWLECPAGAELENEPPLVDGYLDAWNGGCSSPEFGYPFQPLTQPVFCGQTGYYQSASGGAFRDTDWFTIAIPADGVLEITGDAFEPTYMFELGPRDCDAVGVLQSVAIGPFQEASLSITGQPGDEVWFWVGPQHFWDGDTYEYLYVLWLNLTVPVKTRSWTGVKCLFD